MHSNTDLTVSSARPTLRRTLAIILLARWTLNLQFRIAYPFLPAIGRGLGVPLETASLLLTVRAAVAAASPLYGHLADRLGRRTLMLAGLVALVVGSLLSAVAPMFVIVLVAFAILGFAKASYDPAMQAYVGDAVPYAQRGRVLGILELPWALAWLIGMPIAGMLIATIGWRAPFWGIAALGALALAATWRLCPECGRREPAGAQHGEETQDHLAVDKTEQGPLRFSLAVVAPLLVTLLLMLANENVFVVYGAWLEAEFGLSVAAVGRISIVISLAELAAEAASAGFVDRLGKRRAVFFGLALSVVAYGALLPLGHRLGSAMAVIAAMFFAFEFGIVSLLPLISELAPTARGAAMALNVTSMSVGRLLGSLSAPRLWAAGGLALNAAFSAGIVLLAALILWRSVREKGRSA